jgi:hypothetical protein
MIACPKAPPAQADINANLEFECINRFIAIFTSREPVAPKGCPKHRIKVIDKINNYYSKIYKHLLS